MEIATDAPSTPPARGRARCGPSPLALTRSPPAGPASAKSNFHLKWGMRTPLRRPRKTYAGIPVGVQGGFTEEKYFGEDLELTASFMPRYMRKRSAFYLIIGSVLCLMGCVPAAYVLLEDGWLQGLCEAQAAGVLHEIDMHWWYGTDYPLPDFVDCAVRAPGVRGARLVPLDWESKGTISSIVSDIDSPQGRVFFGFIMIGALVLLLSEFPFWLYRQWEGSQRSIDFLFEREGHERMIWNTIVPVGLAIAAIVSSPSGAHGLDQIMTGVHMVSIMGGCVLPLMYFETKQLYMEEALSREYYRMPDQWVRIACIGLVYVNFVGLCATQTAIVLAGYRKYWLASWSFVHELSALAFCLLNFVAVGWHALWHMAEEEKARRRRLAGPLRAAGATAASLRETCSVRSAASLL